MGNATMLLDETYFHLRDYLGLSPIKPVRRGASANYYDERILEHLSIDFRRLFLPGNHATVNVIMGECRTTLAKVDPAVVWQAITADLRKKISQHKPADTLIIARNEMLLFERAKLLLGTTECLMAFLTEPQKVHMLLDILTAFQIKLAHAIMKSGIAGIRFTDDWGTQNALFIHPDLWRTFIKPRMKKLYQVVKEYGGFVFQHSCGHIEEIVGDLVEIGADVLDPCQPQSNDIVAWKRKFGHCLSFMGGLDTQTYLSFCQPTEIKQKVKNVLTVMSDGGGYIAAPSHTITLPEANRRAMVEAIEEFNAGR